MMMMGPMMEMYFHFRVGEPILFREWLPKNNTAYVFSCIAIFAIAVFLEVLKLLRSKLNKPKKEEVEVVNCCCSNVDGTWEIPETRPLTRDSTSSVAPFTKESILSKLHLLSSILFFGQNVIDYSLMLVAMTYNVPIFLSLLAGHTVGFFFVGPFMSIEESETVGGCCS